MNNRKWCKNILSCLMLVCFILPAAGCWDRIEIENRAFAVAIAVDRDAKRRYTVSLAIPSLSQEDSKEKSGGAAVSQASGATFTEALQSLDSQTGKKIYLGQAKMIVLGEALIADADLFRGVMDALDRNTDIDRKVLVLAAAGEGCSVLETHSLDESLPGLYIAELYKNKGKTKGVTFKKDFEQLCAELRSSGGSMLPIIKVQDESLRLSGTLAVKDYAAAEQLNADETRGFLWSTPDGCRDAVITVHADGRPVPLTVTKHDAKLSFSETDGRLRCIVEVRVTGETDEYVFGDDLLSDDHARRSLTRAYAEAIADEVSATAEKMQLKVRFDGYNWNDLLRKKYFELHKKYAPDWTRTFIEMEIIPQVTVTMAGS